MLAAAVAVVHFRWWWCGMFAGRPGYCSSLLDPTFERCHCLAGDLLLVPSFFTVAGAGGLPAVSGIHQISTLLHPPLQRTMNNYCDLTHPKWASQAEEKGGATVPSYIPTITNQRTQKFFILSHIAHAPSVSEDTALFFFFLATTSA